MTIRLPHDLENSINAEVMSGHFASLDDALTSIVRDYFHRKGKPTQDLRYPDPVPTDSKPIWEVVDELRQAVPAEEWEKLPVDGAEQLDHYLYGSPKRPTS